jgi:hypothetical protein
MGKLGGVFRKLLVSIAGTAVQFEKLARRYRYRYLPISLQLQKTERAREAAKYSTYVVVKALGSSAMMLRVLRCFFS